MSARAEAFLSNSSQKRPLSIISEHDGDDLDIIGSKNQHRTATDSKSKLPSPKATQESNKKDQIDLVQSKSSTSRRSHKASKGHKKTQQKTSTLSPQNQASVKKSPTSTSKSNSSKKNPKVSPSQPGASSKCTSVPALVGIGNHSCNTVSSTHQIEGKAALSSCHKGTRHEDSKSLIPDGKAVSTPSNNMEIICTESSSSIRPTERNEPSNCVILENQNCNRQGCIDLRCLSVKDIPSHDDTHQNDVILLILSEDKEHTRRIKEKTSRSISPSPLKSSTQPHANENSKFDHQICLQEKSSNSLNEVNNNTSHVIPQITITPTEETKQPSSLFLFSLRDDITNSDRNKFLANISNNPDNSCSNLARDKNIHKVGLDISSNTLINQPVINRSCLYTNSKRPYTISHFSSTKNAESTGSLFEYELADGDSRALDGLQDPPLMNLSDFWKLKETTEKLRLTTRRPSTMLWRQQFIEGQGLSSARCNLYDGVTQERLTTDRKQRIDDALDQLRNELQDMRSQDQNLARQLLTIRNEIHQLKLQRCTEEHHELIEDFQSELDDLQEFSDVLDFPPPVYGDNPLKHIGVTRLNISARRFSAC